MPLAFYICAGISALFLIFALAKIASHLFDIHKDLCDIHEDLRSPLTWSFMKEIMKENKPGKQREYWRDQNGFKHWRKKKDA